MVANCSRVWCIDNSGIRLGKIITVFNSRRFAYMGELFVFSITKSLNLKNYIKNKVYRGVFITQTKKVRRKDGVFINFNKNTLVPVTDSVKPIGSRLYGPLTKELFVKHFNKDLTKFYLLTRQIL